MSKIKLTGDSSGYVEISAPSAAGNNTLELPSSGSKIVVADASDNVNVTGIITASNVVVTGDLTVNGTTTTLDTVLTEVDKLEVGANNTTVGVAITQSGSGDILRLYDSGTQVVTVKDGGSVGIGTDNPGEKLHLTATSGNCKLRIDAASAASVDFYNNSGTRIADMFTDASTSNFTITNRENASIILRTNGTNERARVSAGGTFYVGTTSFNIPTAIATSGKFNYFSGIYVGKVPDSVNNNSEFVPIHRLGQGQGGQFSGHLIVNSWTGNAYLNLHVTSRYTDDNINWTIINATSNGNISKSTVQLVTATYNSQSWLGFLKNGGGSGVFYMNAYMESNAASAGNSGLRAVTSGYTVTTTHATLNP